MVSYCFMIYLSMYVRSDLEGFIVDNDGEEDCENEEEGDNDEEDGDVHSDSSLDSDFEQVGCLAAPQTKQSSKRTIAQHKKRYILMLWVFFSLFAIVFLS